MSGTDAILKQGDQFHAVFNASLGRKAGGKLALDELEESIKRIIGEDQTQFQFGPAQHGDVLATEPRPPFATLDGALELVKGATGALLKAGEYTTAVQINPGDSVRLFDPHARDDSGFVNGNGKAIIIDFNDKDAFHSYLKSFVTSNGTGRSTKAADDSVPYAQRSFEMTPLFVTSNHYPLQNLHKAMFRKKNRKQVTKPPENTP